LKKANETQRGGKKELQEKPGHHPGGAECLLRQHDKNGTDESRVKKRKRAAALKPNIRRATDTVGPQKKRTSPMWVLGD